MKSKANQIIKVRAEMRRTFFYSVLLRLFSCLMIRHARPSSSHRPRPHPTTPTGSEAHRLTLSPHNLTTSQHPPTATPRPIQGERRTLAPSGWLHALSRAPSVPAGHPRPSGSASEYIYKFCLTLTTPMGFRAAAGLATDENIQNTISL